MKNLTNSNIERQNILNNRFALERIQEYLGIQGIVFENEFKFTKQMIADFYEIDISTVDRYLSKYNDELKHNGYILIRGNLLKDFKLKFGHLINKATKTTVLGLFNFRAFLNLGMLLIESEKARHMRSKILDIVIDTINRKTGSGTKYINQRDADYLLSAIKEPKYRKEFTDALNNCVEMGNYKYALYTDKIYEYIFREKAKEYRKILRLKEDENVRDTMYAEVLDLIASFETGLAYELNKKRDELGRKLSPSEVDKIFKNFAEHPLQFPHIDKARIKMASRDLHFRDAFHRKLEHYLQAVSPDDFERFIGERSIDFYKELEKAEDVFKRLKESKE
ncbi:MAG TPA: DNA-binding protein [Ignavibacteriaceae bacterium]|nr:DNA-binding protein [Ignavibacteriaceae bacterium]HPO56798.1 DNA-binding protein [Ignavibacteriaceae bacterium]